MLLDLHRCTKLLNYIRYEPYIKTNNTVSINKTCCNILHFKHQLTEIHFTCETREIKLFFRAQQHNLLNISLKVIKWLN